MNEKNENENEIINEENKPELEQRLFSNSNNQINDKENHISLNNNINPEEEEENNLIKNEIFLNDEEKEFTTEQINNINENINNRNNINNINNNINANNNSSFQFNPFQKNINIPKSSNNLTKEEKEEQTETNLRNLLTELSNIKQQGNNLFNNKNYEEAEQMYKEGIKKIKEFMEKENIEEINGQIKDYLMNINEINIQFYNNLSISLFKQQKYEESFKKAEYIIQNLNQEHTACYGRILYCLIELKKIILANHYADIIKKKFGNSDSFSKFKDQLNKLEIINKEFSDKILKQNPELKKEIISINKDIEIKKEIKKEEKNDISKYMPYVLGGIVILFVGGRYLYKKYKDK